MELKAHVQHHHNLRGVLVQSGQKGRRMTGGHFCTGDPKEKDQAPKPQSTGTAAEASVTKVGLSQWERKGQGKS